MSKARSMYAGSSGYNYGANKNSPGNGNGKWQGLWPSVGHARNARLINTRAGGDNRNVVFCMNQLGGVGRISNMFASTADGVKDCVPGEYNELKMNLLDYIKLLKNYFKAAYPDYDLVLAGEAENLSQELETCCSISIQHEGFRHISKPEFMQRFPSEIQNAMTIVNNHSKNPSLSF